MIGFKGVLVDLDGTLVDTRQANFKAYRAALAEAGVELTNPWWDANGFGRNWRQFLPDLLGSDREHEAQAIAARKANLYPQFVGETVLNEALVRLVATLRSQLKSALVTTASRSGVDAVLRHHALANLFDTIVTGDDVSAHKPAPDAFMQAANRLGLRPDDCLVIEDSKAGRDAAAAFGAPCLTVGNFLVRP